MLFHAEDPGDTLFVIRSGQVKVVLETAALEQMVGVTHEKINRALEQFEQRGVLTNGRWGITSQRPDLLRQRIA